MRFHGQSAEVDSGDVDEVTKEQNLTFTHGQMGHHTVVTPGTDITMDQTRFQDADLSEFLSRPIKIFETSWAVGAGLSTSFTPWELFFRNASVAEKMKYFKLLRANLHLKFMINGTPFHLGRVMVTYRPLQRDNSTGTGVTSFQQQIIRSQRPRLFLDPSLSQGGCMGLPFFWYNAYMNIPTEDFTELGTVNMDSLVNLGHVSSGTDPVYITVFAYASDVILTVPTTTFNGQSKSVTYKDVGQDEYEQRDGVISTPASSVAHAAGALANVPVIGPFAKATAMAATTVGDIARMFGFARPVQLSDPQFYRNLPFSPMAPTSGVDMSQKLTVDPKQELVIDPRTVGLDGTDEMALKYILSKESYIGTFTWDVADTPDTSIAYFPVTPAVNDNGATQAIAGGSVEAFTSMQFITQCFRQWSGTIVFRFQMVGSQYHRGRLGLLYDANGNPGAGGGFYNKTYSQVLDLDGARDFRVEVAYCQNKAYLRTTNVTVPWTSLGDTGVVNLATTNGCILIKVINSLTVPDGATPVRVNVFVSAGEDFEVRNPSSELFAPFSRFAPQSEQVAFKDPHAESENAPLKPEEVPLMETVKVPKSVDMKPYVFFGESIDSIRQLVKRFAPYLAMKHGGSSSTYLNSFYSNHPLMPLEYGYDSAGIHTTGAISAFNYVNNTFVNYFRGAYAAYRGSMRYKLTGLGKGPKGRLMVHRFTTATSLTATGTTVIQATTGISAAAAEYATVQSDGSAGMALTVKNTMNSLEVEIPFYSAHRFYRNIPSTSDQFDYKLNTWRMYDDGQGDDSSANITMMYVAAGEDFGLFFYIGAPIMYRYTTQWPAA